MIGIYVIFIFPSFYIIRISLTFKWGQWGQVTFIVRRILCVLYSSSRKAFLLSWMFAYLLVSNLIHETFLRLLYVLIFFCCIFVYYLQRKSFLSITNFCHKYILILWYHSSELKSLCLWNGLLGQFIKHKHLASD